MDFKYLFVLCVTYLLLTSALSKPLADRSAKVISDEDVGGVPLKRVERHIAGDGKCPKDQEKVNGVCTKKDSDY